MRSRHFSTNLSNLSRSELRGSADQGMCASSQPMGFGGGVIVYYSSRRTHTSIIIIFNVSMEVLYCSLSRPPVERSEVTRKGEGLETSREPGEPGDVSYTQHENQELQSLGVPSISPGEVWKFPSHRLRLALIPGVRRTSHNRPCHSQFLPNPTDRGHVWIQPVEAVPKGSYRKELHRAFLQRIQDLGVLRGG
jgi:hypothetical protein